MSMSGATGTVVLVLGALGRSISSFHFFHPASLSTKTQASSGVLPLKSNQLWQLYYMCSLSMLKYTQHVRSRSNESSGEGATAGDGSGDQWNLGPKKWLPSY